MPQPPAFVRQTSFTDHSEEQPSVPHSGVALDAEFNAVAATVAAVLANLLLIQRDDGALKNGVAGIEALSAGVLALINASSGITAGAWVTAHAYTAGANWVSQGTGTYICAISHTSGTFATDLAAGKWVLIYDTAGTTPADGSVTAAKLAAAAVTAAAIGFTSLDLAGTIRAQGGLASGTAAVGEILAGKRASGNVVGKIDRATKAQGVVAWKIGGGSDGNDWYFRMVGGSDVLELYDELSGFTLCRWVPGFVDVAGALRVTSDVATPITEGAGIQLRYSGGIGYVESYDYTASAWRAGQLRASTWTIVCNGVTVASANSAGMNFPVEATVGGGADPIGYRNVPQNRQDGAYTIAAADSGGCIFSKNAAGQTITIPANASVAIPVETVLAIRNRGANPITLAPAVGVTLRWAGSASTGSRTLSTTAFVGLYQEEADSWVVIGPGIS